MLVIKEEVEEETETEEEEVEEEQEEAAYHTSEKLIDQVTR
jgi:hypothetical protein